MARQYHGRGESGGEVSPRAVLALRYSLTAGEGELIENGVPQESILGPPLFITYIEEICNISNEAKFLLFAATLQLP